MAEDRIIETSGPADNPTFTVLVDGAALDAAISVISVSIIKEVNRIATAELVLHDGEASSAKFELSETPEFQPGKEVEIKAGYEANEESVFKGIITGQSIKVKKGRPPVLCIELKDIAVKMTVGRKSKYFFESSDSDIIEEIIGEYGIDNTIEATDVTHAEMVQFDATDWDFIVTRAEKNGKLVFAFDGNIEVKAPDLSAEPVVSPIYGDSMMEFESLLDAKYQYTAVSSFSWDPSTQEMIDAEAEEPDVEEQGLLTGTDLASIIGPDIYEIRHSGRVTDQELQAWADAQLLKSRLAKIRGRVKITGFPGVNPGDIMELRGLGDTFNGKVLVSAVAHAISNKGWSTDIQFGLREKWFSSEANIVDSAAAGLVPGVHGLQVGVVSQLGEDPDSEDRVLVKIPVVSTEDDGMWARVATLDAGDGRGSFFRPEIGDEVVLGFMNGDPRHPVILGMMNSSSKPAPITAEDDNHEKGFVTRSGIKLMFNDDEISITLETPAGNSLVLSDDEKGLIFTDENKNSITLSKDGIEIKSAKDLIMEAKGDVKIKGVNVEQSASAKYSAKGSAGSEVTTDAILTMKGSLVKIN
jgi:Rhs element Vgr protein